MYVLIAEDDAVSRAALSGILRKLGHEVRAVSGGDAALELLLQEQTSSLPDLILLDWIMPDTDGIEVCHQVRERYPLAPPYIIMVTARTESDAPTVAIAAGADDYVSKPFDAGEIETRIAIAARILSLLDQHH